MLEQGNKKLRLIELLIVLFVPILPTLISSVYIFSTDRYLYNHSSDLTNYGLVAGSVRHILSLGLLYYVLFRQGRTSENIGFAMRPIDLAIGIGIYAVTFILYKYSAKGIYLLVPDKTHLVMKAQNTGFLEGSFLLAFIYSFINPFFEELIVRAYGMTEVEFLTGSKTAAVIIITLFQCSYHLYQGLIPALLLFPIFLMYSIYFAKFKSITPVIIAHLITDMVALIIHQH